MKEFLSSFRAETTPTGGNRCRRERRKHAFERVRRLFGWRAQAQILRQAQSSWISCYRRPIPAIRVGWLLASYDERPGLRVDWPGIVEFSLTWSNGTGIGPLCSVYLFLSRPITLSTCIRTCASCLDISASSCESCFLPLVNAGISNCPPWVAMSSPSYRETAIR